MRVAIAGSAQDPGLATMVKNFASRDDRVIPVIRFITDDEVPTLFGWCDAVVTPFERTLTSGSVVLAFTRGRPVILPELARVIDIATDENAVFYPLGQLKELLPRLHKGSLQAMRFACGEHRPWAGPPPCELSSSRRESRGAGLAGVNFATSPTGHHRFGYTPIV